ncbi:MBL fold metallo-hydrolase [Staphylococcus pseudintermedius]|uniref:MBL fold metallo-hydrolase n=1 Tax=Staphylococcus pseudintermedius TaxID=283734 RepID=UPI0019F9B983|nr:MBL fold metallo-hydrolase [Staphylococcus pseudintermedius]EGQ3902551.1 MBL fold metallo-hydrolase [Staphylococcus pseudintermedius]WMZ76040.1 MBL fold metallo-hydrolase [Staphylococcus pseudintermedius]WMZ88394.1 MBL fold metallo-hydrolase [Staphylococcus pseudintermedius]
MLIESGVKFQTVQKHLKFKTRDIAGCLITHEHGDHAKYIKQFVDAGVECYATLGTLKALAVTSHRLNIIKAKKAFRIGTWQILPFDIEHDVAEPVAFLLKSDNGYKVLYVTDTKYLKYSFDGITHMLLEINYIYEQMQQNIKEGSIHQALANRIMDSHFSLEYAIQFLKANDLSKLQEIHLIHLSSSNSNAQIIKEQVQRVSGVPVYIGGI